MELALFDMLFLSVSTTYSSKSSEGEDPPHKVGLPKSVVFSDLDLLRHLLLCSEFARRL